MMSLPIESWLDYPICIGILHQEDCRLFAPLLRSLYILVRRPMVAELGNVMLRCVLVELEGGGLMV